MQDDRGFDVREMDAPTVTATAVMGEAERQQVLWSWNDTALAYPQGVCVHELFEQQATRTPDAVAVVFEAQQLTYAELNRRANQLAHHLQTLGVRPEVVVGLSVERSPEMLVGMLGILKAGGAYLPLDPELPPLRLAHMIEDARVWLVLTQERWCERWTAHAVQTLQLDGDSSRIDALPEHAPPSGVTAENLVYVIYTSGSTGLPKGVSITHRGVVQLMKGDSGVAFDRDDVVLQLTTFAFDPSIFEIWGALLNGARLVLYPGRHVEAATLQRLIEQHGASFAVFSASLFHSLMDENLSALTRVRQVMSGGETLSLSTARRFAARNRGGRLVNVYGATEATMYSVCFDTRHLQADDVSVPVGRPISNAQVYVLDETLQPVRVGVAGEVYIAGEGLARGYHNRPGLTAQRFVANPFGQCGQRMYRTGDWGRWRADGQLEFVGRRDHQVKLRGYRIELSEIEAALMKEPVVRQAAVVMHEQAGQKRLIAYVTPAENALDATQLRRHLERELPEYMVPWAFVLLPELPLTINGKLDRQALPAPSPGTANSEYQEPRTAIEEALARIWAEVLGLTRVGIQDDFFALGGDSLVAMRVITRIREVLRVELPLRALFEASALMELAERVTQLCPDVPEAALPPLPVRASDEQVPLSFAQERLWFLDRMGLVGSAYHVPIVVRMSGSLEVTALQRGVAELVRRHESLRTHFALHGGNAVQVIAPAQQALDWTIEDLSELSAEQREQRARQCEQQQIRAPFDLQQGPLFRARLLKLEAQAHVLLLTMHHIIIDGWSLGILMRELGVLYGAYAQGQDSPLPVLQLQYADYALWQRQWLHGEVLAQQLAYWKQTLQGSAVLELPTDRARPAVQSFRGALVPVALSASLTQQLSELARAEGATLFMVLLAGIQVLLSRWSGQQDIVVGSPIAGRTHPQTEALVGFFVNMLALRTELAGALSFRQVLERVKQATLSAYAHQDVPFEKVVEALQPQRELSRQPLFQVNFTLQNMPLSAPPLRGLQVQLSGSSEHVSAQYDLSFLIEHSAAGLHGHIEYASDLFERSTVERVSAWLGQLLQAAVDSPQRAIHELPLMAAAQRQQLVEQWNHTQRPYPQCCIQQLFTQQAQRSAQAIAVAQGAEQLSYAELERCSNQLARHLIRMGVGPEVVVGLCVQRTLPMVIAVLGILKAGGAYLPLDPSYPAERLSFMLQDARAGVVLTHSTLEEALPAHWGRVVLLDEHWAQIERHSGEPLPSVGCADNLAYVMYTSGSTGMPKGVAVTHRNIVRLIDPVPINAQDVILQLAPLSFDASTFEIWAALLRGAKLVLAPAAADLSQVPQLIQDCGVSVLWLTAGLFHQMVDLYLAQLRGLRMLLAGGDALAVAQVRQVRAALPHCQMINGYGPTECTTFSTWQQVRELPASASTVPIGTALPNTQLYVLDGYGEVVPIGVVGELYIAGQGLARGYLGRPGLTAQRFVPHPFVAGERVYRTGDLVRWNAGGELEFIGRSDQQVKVRGYRIELGEIESALNAHGSVSQAVVVAREDAPGEKRLVGYVVASAGEDLSSAQLREYLEHRLPQYMVPAVVMVLHALPLTPNGKVDRPALPAPELRAEATTYEAPRTQLEAVLAQIWADVLCIERVGIHDDFFDVGGDSIRALHVQAEAQKRGYEFALQDLFGLKQIAPLAAVTRRGATLRESIEPFSLISAADRTKAQQTGCEDAYPLSLLQAGLVFHNLWERGSATYHDVISHEVHAPLAEAAFMATAQSVVDRHPILRTTIHLEEYGEPLQCVHHQVRAHAQAEDWSDLTESEQQHQLHEWVQRESRNDFDLASGPLVRFHACRLRQNVFQFLLSIHHAVIDGWSVAALTTEFYEEYLQRLTGIPVTPRAPLQMHYRDFIAQERRALEVPEHEQYWDGVVSRLERAPLWRLDRPVVADDTQPARELSETLSLSFPADLVQRVAELARHQRVPVKSVLFAAHLNALRAFMGGREVQTGLVMHARPEGIDAEKVVGLFLNTVPICFVSEGGSWEALVQQALRLEQEALAHRTYPVVEIYRRHGGKELLDVIFNYVNFHVAHSLVERLQVKQSRGAFETNFPIAVSVEFDAHTSRSATLIISYQVSRFARTQMETLQALHVASLHEMLERPQQPYLSHSLLPPQDRGLLTQWNRTARSYPRACVHELVAQQVQRSPHAVALQLGDEQLTYLDLERRANQLARHLLGLGVGPESLVGVFMERSFEMVIGLYGILKAGGAYVPVDPDYPSERVAFMVQDSHVQVLLTQQRLVARLPVHEARLICLDTDWPVIAAESSASVASTVAPQNSAYVIYTSGSTGRPKGAVNTHLGICNRLLWMQETYRLTTADRVLQKTPFSFDVSVWEFFWPLLAGARLVVARPEGHKDSAYLATLIAAQGITTLHFVPSMLNVFLQTPGIEACRSLQRVICSGEALSFDLQERFFQRLDAQLHNLYGPTEAAVDVTYWECKPQDSRRFVPIGRPLANTQIHVLDANLHPVPIGVAGELHIGGVQVGRGYLNRPELTAEKFIRDPFSTEPDGRLYKTGDLARYLSDGAIEYLGRLDHQVKVRGFRIELGEIEAALVAHPAIQEAVVVTGKDGLGNDRLVAYLVPNQDRAPAVRQLLQLEKEGLLAGQSRYELPNGMTILHKNKNETDFTYQEIFEQQLYTRHGITLGADSCIFDVGANIGLFSLFAAQMCERAVIYAFEPVPALCNILRLNSRLHGVNAKVFECGLASTAGSDTFTYYANVSVLSGRFADTAEERQVVKSFLMNQPPVDASEALLDEMVAERLTSERIVCQLRTLSEVMHEHGIERIDLLKIDAEKSESDVLAGIRAADWPKIQRIVMEVHDIDGRLEQMRSLLEGHGYRLAIEQAALLEDTSLHSIYAVRPACLGSHPLQEPRNSEPQWSSAARLISDARQFSKRQLPEYMVPAAFVLLPALPLTPNGKVDRRALPAAEARAAAKAYEPPRTAMEHALARIWAQVLSVEKVGLQDDFFELGGHSLLATSMVARVRSQLGIDIGLRVLFELPVFSAFARRITALSEFLEGAQQGAAIGDGEYEEGVL